MPGTTKETLKFDVAVKLFGKLKIKVTAKAVIKKMREMGYVCQLSDRQVFRDSYKDPFVSFYNPKKRINGEVSGDSKEYWDDEMVYVAALKAIEKETQEGGG